MNEASDNTRVNTVVAFSPYSWDHALTILRLVSPLRYADLQLIHGIDDWKLHPENISLGDVIVTQRDFPRYRKMYTKVLEQANAEGKPLIYEIDDLLLEIPDEHPDHSINYYTPGLFDMLQAIIEADLVTTTNTALRAYLQPFNPHILVLPNYLDEALWVMPKINEKPNNDQVVIGYMGSNTHLPDLEQVAPVLQKLLNRYHERIQFRFWGCDSPEAIREYPQVRSVQLETVNYPGFTRFFLQQECDIFIAPLKDSLFNRCKSNIKFLEYSALGIPGVYSRITPYEDIVEHGKNGFLAGTNEEWENCLTALIEDSVQRTEMGRSAQHTVQENWLISQHAYKWTQAYQAAIHIASDKGAREQKHEYLRVITRIASQVREWQNGLEEQLQLKDQEIAELEKRVLEAEHFQNELKNSSVWKFVRYIWRIRSIFSPIDNP